MPILSQISSYQYLNNLSQVLYQYSNYQQKTSFSKEHLIDLPVNFHFMTVAEYDAFALRSYSFAVRKTNNFFSLSTILLSLLILVLAFFINFATIQHLWIPRSQLIIQAYQSLSNPIPLTSTLACYKSTNTSVIPTVRLVDTNLNQVAVQVISQQTISTTNPQLYQYIGGGFACIDLAGMISPGIKPFYIDVGTASVNLYLKATSINEQIFGTFQPPIVINSKNTTTNSWKTYLMSFMSISISQKLYLNYQAQNQFTVQAKTATYCFTNTAKTFTTTGTVFALTNYFPSQSTFDDMRNYNNRSLTIVRYSIAYIIGIYLSWISILTLIFGFIVAPIMDASLNLNFIQTLFHMDPQMQKPSVLRFIIASIKSRLFQKEDKFVKLNQTLEKLKDIGFILKLQLLLGRITVKKSQHEEIMISQHSFENVPKEDVGISLYSEKTNNNMDIMDGSQDQPKIGMLTSVRQKVLKALDSGSDSVSITFDGKGYGSKCSFIITATFVIGFIAFLMIFGVFNFSTTTTSLDIIGKTSFNYQIPTTEIFLMTASTTPIVFSMLDGNYKFLSTAPITNDTNYCLSMVPSSLLSTVAGKTIYCLTSPLTLQYSQNPSQAIMLNADISQVDQSDFIYLYSMFNLIQGNNLIPNIKRNVFVVQNPGMYQQMPMQILQYSNSTLSGNYAQYLTTSNALVNSLSNNIAGVVIKITSLHQIITIRGTLLDVVQNIWSFAIICFSVMLMKITKYINLREKEKVLSPQRSDYRDNICILMSKINGLLTGRNKPEISTFKYYIKAPLNRNQE